MRKKVKWVRSQMVTDFGFDDVNENLEKEIVLASQTLPVVEGYETPVRSLADGSLVVVVRNEKIIVELVDWRWDRVVREVVGEVVEEQEDVIEEQEDVSEEIPTSVETEE